MEDIGIKKKNKELSIMSKAIVMIVICTIAVLSNRNNISYMTMPTLGISGDDIQYGNNGYVSLYMNRLRYNYSAFDMTLAFDKDLIEILSIDKGDIKDISDDSISLMHTDIDIANESGNITFAYIDMTGGTKPLDITKTKSVVAYITIRPKKPHSETAFDILSLHLVRDDGIEDSKDTVLVRTGRIRIE